MYQLTGILIHSSEAGHCASLNVVCVSLHAGFSLIPIEREFVFLLEGEGTEFDENPAIVLPPEISRLMQAFTEAAYVEAAFWGGEGTQAGILHRSGDVVYGPEIHPGAINAVLRRMGAPEDNRSIGGIRMDGGKDLFETVGLEAHRTVAEWLSA